MTEEVDEIVSTLLITWSQEVAAERNPKVDVSIDNVFLDVLGRTLSIYLLIEKLSMFEDGIELEFFPSLVIQLKPFWETFTIFPWILLSFVSGKKSLQLIFFGKNTQRMVDFWG